MSTVGKATRTDASFVALGTTTLTDPTNVKFIVRLPDLTEVEYEFGVAPEVTKLGTGQYRLELILTQARTHWIRPWGYGALGTVNDANEVAIEVEESYFNEPMPE